MCCRACRNHPKKRTPSMTAPPSLAAQAEGLSADLWSRCVDFLAQEIPEQQFNTWIRPLAAAVSNDPLRVTIQVANRFKMDWVRSQYAQRISQFCARRVRLWCGLARRTTRRSQAGFFGSTLSPGTWRFVLAARCSQDASWSTCLRP